MRLTLIAKFSLGIIESIFNCQGDHYETLGLNWSLTKSQGIILTFFFSFKCMYHAFSLYIENYWTLSFVSPLLFISFMLVVDYLLACQELMGPKDWGYHPQKFPRFIGTTPVRLCLQWSGLMGLSSLILIGFPKSI